MTEKTAKEKTITSQYAELNRFSQNGEHERALKAANKILGVAPNEFPAFHCKIVALIELQKFDDAISLINKNPQFLHDLVFEKAYCYYRVNKHKEALDIIEQNEERADLRIKELKAQILYRLERFPESASLYQDIIKNTNDDYDDERHTNLSAVSVYLDAESDDDSLGDGTYELCYNKACLFIENGLYSEAEKKLRQCEKLCREVLEEDESTEEEIDLELALIRIQLAYVYQKQGRIKEAQQLYVSNLKLKIEDIALAAVASNNIVCINKDQNLFDSKKKMKVALNDNLTFKLPSKQRKYIALNNAIFNFYINQNDQCEKCCKQIETTWPELSLHTTVLSALNLVKADKFDQAIKLLETFANKGNKDDVLFIKLCIAQLNLVQGDKLKACKVLENLGDDSYRPAIVGALTTLYLGLGDEATALKVFEKTVDWYKKNKTKNVDLSTLWRQAADFHIKNGHPQVAANSLEELLRSNKDDKKIVAQLIMACSQFDKNRALELSKQLPTIKELSVGVDLDNLNVLTSSSSTSVTAKKSPGVRQDSNPSTPKTDDSVKRKKKHKKGKLPKNYDPNVAPDPERWLPKYERTGYRKKRDRRTKDVIKGSQGTASGQADQYDFSKYVEEGNDSPASSNVEPSPRGSAGKGQFAKNKNQKKKNKRR
ncbi:signal recognition particle subunit SRP72 [Aethina tumida]|uniref:signal recognition particle subunit SRP72 n=1 Tax=Aethina tumida TaxID=116153 RepID=UPI00096B0BFD|nr:signal recognition particle subunit SRP72 [Aethina tumida]